MIIFNLILQWLKYVIGYTIFAYSKHKLHAHRSISLLKFFTAQMIYSYLIAKE